MPLRTVAALVLLAAFSAFVILLALSHGDPEPPLVLARSTDCKQCHGTASWDALGFPQHDSVYFPINSGNHAGVWSACSDCHVVPGDFGRFECIDCHAHRQDEMARQHDEVGGYSYVSSECYRCHPRGIADDD